ncbi:MAG: hypothetical protein IJF40_07935 [Clostridia bacterium]|nr:hypothetical protein [Clostridia bacterium]
MTKRILALVMALCLVFALAACNNGGNDDETTTGAADTAVNGETVVDTAANNETEAASGDTTDVSADASTEAASENETEAASQNEADAPAKKPQTTAEILEYFNTAINKVKPNSKSITCKYLKNSQAGRAELGNLPGFIQDMANDLISSNMGEDEAKKNKTVTSAAEKNALFAVENQSWSSKLGVNNIQSATLKESNGSYIITINVKPDEASANISYGAGNTPKAFSVVTPKSITDNAGPAASIIKDVNIGYRNGKIVATIDAATGNVTDVDYYFEWNLKLTAVGINVSIWFGINQVFSIAW